MNALASRRILSFTFNAQKASFCWLKTKFSPVEAEELIRAKRLSPELAAARVGVCG